MLLLFFSCILFENKDVDSADQDTSEFTDCTSTREVTYSAEINIPMGCPLLTTEAPNAFYNYKEAYELQLPNQVCTLDIEIDSTNLIFDDHIIFAINQHILFLSDGSIAEHFSNENNEYIYSWGELQGQVMDPTFDPVCTVPCNQAYDTMDNSNGYEGSFQQRYDSSILELLTPSFNNSVFTVVSFGDNDEQDCWIDGLSYTLRMTVPN
jgi:hypothetical protein